MKEKKKIKVETIGALICVGLIALMSIFNLIFNFNKGNETNLIERNNAVVAVNDGEVIDDMSTVSFTIYWRGYNLTYTDNYDFYSNNDVIITYDNKLIINTRALYGVLIREENLDENTYKYSDIINIDLEFDYPFKRCDYISMYGSNIGSSILYGYSDLTDISITQTQSNEIVILRPDINKSCYYMQFNLYDFGYSVVVGFNYDTDNKDYSTLYDIAYNMGYNDATSLIDSAYNDGYSAGYGIGYNAGVLNGSTSNFSLDLGTLLTSVVIAPVQFLANTFNFNIPGTNINLFGIFTFLFTCTLIFFVIKLFRK